MGCSEGSCSCGKGNQTPVEENIRLVQLPGSQGKLSTFDTMKGLGNMILDEDVVEVRFKNNRKAFFRNRFGLSVDRDDRIVVEMDGGHDLGTVTLTGEMAEKQFRQKDGSGDKALLKKVYRKATQVDLESWLNAKKREREMLIEARRLAGELGLSMSISDAEFQGDGRKVTIFFNADKRVDFRELVKRYASAFRAKVEMKQIGVRQDNIYISLNKKGKRVEIACIPSTESSVKPKQ